MLQALLLSSPTRSLRGDNRRLSSSSSSSSRSTAETKLPSSGGVACYADARRVQCSCWKHAAAAAASLERDGTRCSRRGQHARRLDYPRWLPRQLQHELWRQRTLPPSIRLDKIPAIPAFYSGSYILLASKPTISVYTRARASLSGAYCLYPTIPLSARPRVQ